VERSIKKRRQKERYWGKVQFSSLSRARCNDWLESNFPDNESE
jgi:hypothetical protein